MDLGLALVGTVTKDERGTDSAEMSSPTPAKSTIRTAKQACTPQPTASLT